MVLSESKDDAWASKLLFGGSIDDWQLYNKHFRALIRPEFEHLTDAQKGVIGLVLLSIGIQDGRAYFDGKQLILTNNTFEQYIEPQYAALHKEAVSPPIDSIYLENARRLLFKDGTKGWEFHASENQESLSFYARTLTTPEGDIPQKTFPTGMNDAMLSVLNKLGVQGATTDFAIGATEIIVKIPAESFEKTIKPKVNEQDAGSLALPAKNVVKRRH